MARAVRAWGYQRAAAVALFVVAGVGCGSDPSAPKPSPGKAGAAGSGGARSGSGGFAADSGGAGEAGAADRGGFTSAGGTSSKGGSGGATATGGSGGTLSSGGTSGAATAGGSTASGGGAAMGSQPLGAICANDANCSNTEGAAVCCESTCTLADQCTTGGGYLPCNSTADCSQYGGGKLCCEVDTGGQTMRFCTKQSGCSGKKLP